MLNKKLVANVSPVNMIGMQMLGALICVTLCFPFYSHWSGSSFELPSARDTLYLLVLSWACTIVTFFLWMMALKKVSAFTSNMVLALEPIYGIILAFLFYKEYQDVSSYFYLGFFMIGLAVYIHNQKLHKTQ